MKEKKSGLQDFEKWLEKEINDFENQALHEITDSKKKARREEK
jgi:hypothetical protein